MRLETISQTPVYTLNSIRKQIQDGHTLRVMENPSGWRYGGEEFLKLVDTLQREITVELQEQDIKVLACTVRRFNRDESIRNRLYPTKRLIIIPLNGESKISPDELLPMDTYCYIEGVPTLHGEDMDVVVVAYELKPTVKK